MLDSVNLPRISELNNEVGGKWAENTKSNTFRPVRAGWAENTPYSPGGRE